MSDTTSPRVFISYTHDSPEHKADVRRFALFLRSGIGIDVHLDQWYDVGRRDWAEWAEHQIRAADFVLVIASPDYRRRSGSPAEPGDGPGSRYEIAIMRDMLTQDRDSAIERLLPVVLPGRAVSEIPQFLNPYSTTRFSVSRIDDDGVAELLAALHWDGSDPLPPMPEREGPLRVARVAAWRAHRSVRRDGARIDGRRYADSIVLRPAEPGAGFVEVDLGGHYRRLTSVVGVLDDATQRYQVGCFRVRVDGTPREERRVAIGKPATIDVDVTGATTLRLEMYRPGSAGPPELAWGDPTLT